MANPKDDYEGQVREAVERAKDRGPMKKKREYHAQRRVEALSLRLAGLSFGQIGERLEISEKAAYNMVNRALERAENPGVTQMRELENQRLDRAQAAIWPKVLKGEVGAIHAYLQISSHRTRINGLNAPTNINVNVGIKQEMESALSQLEELVVEAEVVEPAEQQALTAEVVDDDEEPAEEALSEDEDDEPEH